MPGRGVGRPTRWQCLFVSFLELLCILHLSSSATQDDCPCNKHHKPSNSRNISDHAEVGKTRQIQCCAIDALGFSDPEAILEWTFQGKPLQEDKNSILVCRNETLYIKEVEESDEGVYTCTVTSSNGTRRSVNNFLSVCTSSGFREGPKDNKVAREKVCAEEGGMTELSCGAMVGKPGCTSGRSRVSWWFIMPNGTWSNLPKGVVQSASTSQVDKKGIIRSSLVFQSVTDEHYGNYSCTVRNDYGSIRHSITLMKGDPVYCGHSNMGLLALTSAAAGVGVVLWILYCWWRCRRTLAVCLMEKNYRKSPADGIFHDVFIIHGQNASQWVTDILLPNLENIYGYSCFIPDRNMLAGEQIAEAISEAMLRCRRILVVMTPCLLQSRWAEWTVHHGIQTCLTSSTQLLAIVLQEFGSDVVSSETTGLLRTLETVKKIKVPKSCRLQDVDVGNHPARSKVTSESTPNNADEVKRRSNLSVNIPIYSNLSPLENKCLSNMIAGSNHASREEGLDEGKDARFKDTVEAKGQSVIYIDDQEEDPGSPCSNSPFIMPSCKTSANERKQSEPCHAFGSCVRRAFVGDPEIRFWQKIRLRLDPPTVLRKRNLTEESTA